MAFKNIINLKLKLHTENVDFSFVNKYRVGEQVGLKVATKKESKRTNTQEEKDVEMLKYGGKSFQ